MLQLQQLTGKEDYRKKKSKTGENQFISYNNRESMMKYGGYCVWEN